MQISEQGLIMVAGLEGGCLSPYLDSVGVVTIGFGSTVSEIPHLSLSHPDITMQQAIDLLSNGMQKYVDALNRALTIQLSQTQFDALASWVYNTGYGGLAKRTAIIDCNCGAFELVPTALMMWNKPPEIIKRRQKEAALFHAGVYSGNGKANIFPVNSSHHPMYSKGHEVDVASLLHP